MILGLENVEFVCYGVMYCNSFMNFLELLKLIY